MVALSWEKCLEDEKTDRRVGPHNDIDDAWQEEGRQFDAASWAILAAVFVCGLLVGIGISLLLLS